MSDKLSALVVAHNEEDHLEDCLTMLAFADEIVVVLDKCTDNSYRIASKHTNKLVEGSWSIEGERRNKGISECSGDWILEIDADERVTTQLAEEIKDLLKNGSDRDYFYIPFENYIGDRLVKHGWGCYWGVRSAPRLFKKGAKTWGDELVHPSYSFVGVSGRLENVIAHFVDKDISDMIKRFDRYTDAHAQELVNSGKIGGFWNNFRRIFSRFSKCYIARKGYKEGRYGFLNAVFAGFYPLVSYMKASEKISKNR